MKKFILFKIVFILIYYFVNLLTPTITLLIIVGNILNVHYMFGYLGLHNSIIIAIVMLLMIYPSILIGNLISILLDILLFKFFRYYAIKYGTHAENIKMFKKYFKIKSYGNK